MTGTFKEWYVPEGIRQLDSPALLVFTDRVKQNIQTAVSMVGDLKRFRPHVKTNKSPGACQQMIDAGVSKFKCATIAEAEMLGSIEARDVLIAYQTLGPKLQRLIQLVKRFPRTTYSCLVDNMEAAREQSETFSRENLRIPVFVDLNVGMNRTGILPGREAIELCTFCSDAPGIEFRGLHAYDGHIRHPDIQQRTRECNSSFETVTSLQKEICKTGLPVPTIIAGGSPTFPIHAKRENVECSPGTFIYWDKNYLDNCAEQDFLPAAVLVTRIISLPTAQKICTDLGHKSVAAENEINKRVYFLNAPEIQPVSQSEEHLVCEVNKGHSFQTGDILYGIPFHICPTVALYERAICCSGGKITGEWKNVARDRTITI